MLKVIVDRQHWFRGKGTVGSRLCLPYKEGEQPMRCCIGFLGQALGLSDHEMLDQSTLLCVVLDHDLLQTKAVKETGIFNCTYENVLPDAYCTNDLRDITDHEREKRLKEIGRKMDVDFEFIN